MTNTHWRADPCLDQCLSDTRQGVSEGVSGRPTMFNLLCVFQEQLNRYERAIYASLSGNLKPVKSYVHRLQ